MKSKFLILFIILISSIHFSSAQYLTLSENQRFLMKDDGTPFFWLGDTAWELFHRLDRAEIKRYLDQRSANGYNVVQAVVLSEINGLTVPNQEGHLPLINMNPETPNEDYFKLIDWAVDYAASKGIYFALLPTWGSHVEDKPHVLFDNVHPFTPDNAEVYTHFLGERYKNTYNVIWVLGGDRAYTSAPEIWDAMAKGLIEGDEKKHLITFHPYGTKHSSEWLHDKEWLDFNMIQTGHYRFSDNVYDDITVDYQLKPVKPTINGEPAYEDIPQWFSENNKRYTDYEIRKLAYWSVFAGAFGHTYGNNNVWQMYKPEFEAIIYARIPWDEAIEQPGSLQFQYLRYLIESRPFFSRIPDQSILIGDNEPYMTDYCQATRDGTLGENDASYLMVYCPISRDLVISTSCIPTDSLKGYWYNPVNGNSLPIEKFKNTGTFKLSTWSSFPKRDEPGSDWVLILEDLKKNYPIPGEPFCPK